MYDISDMCGRLISLLQAGWKGGLGQRLMTVKEPRKTGGVVQKLTPPTPELSPELSPAVSRLRSNPVIILSRAVVSVSC